MKGLIALMYLAYKMHERPDIQFPGESEKLVKRVDKDIISQQFKMNY